ncbi:hypothetical protein [Cytobacillus firmus]|uniref:hypothetical protein n=1 Tax=Cytobacillus firmus TaxID=1399 RepID=UPI0022284E2A|nr:hypothetical protein [Cytobacillus firmus]
MDEQGNDHDNQVKTAIYKAAPSNGSGLFILLAFVFSEVITHFGYVKCQIGNPLHSLIESDAHISGSSS